MCVCRGRGKQELRKRVQKKNLNKVLLPAKDTYVSVRYTLSAGQGRSVNYPASKYLMRFTQGNEAGARTHTHTPRQWKSERERERKRAWVRAREQNNIRGIQSLRLQKKHTQRKIKTKCVGHGVRPLTLLSLLPQPRLGRLELTENKQLRK